jgi:hypothetical protein
MSGRKYDKLHVLLCFILVFPCILAWCWSLSQISTWIAGQFAGTVFQARLSGWAWVIPSLIPGAFSTELLATILFRLLSRRDPQYARHGGEQLSYGPSKVIGVSVQIALLAFAASLVMASLHWRAIFTADRIVIYPFFSLSSVTYSYTDIVSINTAPLRRAPSGKIVKNGDEDYVIGFCDGYKWSTHWVWAGTDDSEKIRLLKYVSAKSGKPIRQLQILEDEREE